MFTRIIDTLRTSSNNNNSRNSNSRRRDIPEINFERRSSMDEDNVNSTSPTQQQRNSATGTESALSSPRQDLSNTSSPTTPTATGMKRGTGTNAIGIKSMDANNGSGLTGDTVVYPDGRRRSSLFGYSTNAADDYMQKDLLSSSWS